MDEAASPVVSVQGLVKKFGQFRALDGLDLTVSPGEVHGFLGPNGAGKSTTIRALLGLLRTDAGSLSVFGLDPWADSVAPGSVAKSDRTPSSAERSATNSIKVRTSAMNRA